MVEDLAREEQQYGANMAAVGVVASCVPLLMLGMVVTLRSGYSTPVRGLMGIVGVSLLVVNAIALGRSRAWYRCGLAVTFYVLASVTALGLSPLSGNRLLLAVLSVAGLACMGRNLIRTWRALGAAVTLGLILLGVFLGAYFGSSYWADGSQHDILYPEAVVGGAVHADIAMEAAIVNMISTYQVPSTGVDGVVKLKYHNGAFWAGEALRRLCRMPAVDFMAFGYGMVVLPFYIATFFGLVESLRSSLDIRPSALPLAAWFVGVVAIIGLVPYIENLVRANFNVIIINSDSCILGLGLVFVFGGMAAKLAKSFPVTLLPPSRMEQGIVAAAIPGALAIIGFVKIPFMYMIIPVLGYLWLRVRRMRRWVYTSGIALSAVAFLLMLRADSGAAKADFVFFTFDRVHPEWVPYFFLIHFVWVWILAITWVLHYRVHTLAEMREAIRTQLSLPVELVIVSAIVGLIPYFVFYFNSPSWVYFTLFHALLAGAFIAAVQPQVRMGDVRQRLRNGTMPSAAVLTFAIVLIVAGHLGATTLGSCYRVLKRNGEVRALLGGREASYWRSELRSIASPDPALAPSLVNRQEVLDCLSDIGQRPREARKETVLYIPKTNRTYWDMRQLDPGTTPFLAPAFSGVAMVEGLPEYEDIGYAAIGWGYLQYRLPTQPQRPQERLDQAVEEARKDGFKTLLVLRGASNAGCGVETVNLNQDAASGTGSPH